MNQNIKALLSRGIIAMKALEVARTAATENVKSVVDSPNTARVVIGFLGAATPKGLDAAVRCVEALTGLYEEVSVKAHVLNQAMPAIAEAILDANALHGLVQANELISIGKELEVEAKKAKKAPSKRAVIIKAVNGTDLPMTLKYAKETLAAFDPSEDTVILYPGQQGGDIAVSKKALEQAIEQAFAGVN